MRVLLHACCGPCATYPVDALAAEGIETRLFFYNPNIHPFQEFEKRLEAVKELSKKRDVPLIVDDDYDLEGWLRKMVFRESKRCSICYETRLARAARLAKKSGFDAFTTSLLFSKQQYHDRIRDLAEAVAEEVGIPFLYRDFREGYKAGVESSKAMGLYRQEYCGCIYSERDRFHGKVREVGNERC